MLRVKHLSKTIRGKKILKDLSFEIDHGKIAIFLGKSGVGKSTLLRILNNLDSYDYGSFTLDGYALNLADVNRAHTVGMVFQHFNLFEHLNAEENIVFALTHCKGLGKREAKY
ncbi:MAG: ATP-binding cassette domain-containing protein, partial [Legionellales bacterium]